MTRCRPETRHERAREHVEISSSNSRKEGCQTETQNGEQMKEKNEELPGETLRVAIEHLTVLFPTEVSSFDFQVECTDRTVQYKLDAQSLRLFGLHRDVNDAHRAGANRLQNKKNNQEGVQEVRGRRCSWRLHGAWWFVKHCQNKCSMTDGLYPKKRETFFREKQGHARRKLSSQLVEGGCGRQEALQKGRT